MSNQSSLGPGPRSTIKRHPDRAHYDTDAINAVIDEALFCHVSFVVAGEPRCIPTVHARIGDKLYLHGAVANFMLRSGSVDARLCVSFTLLDGLVMARSAYNHSMNYRSVVAFGRGCEVTDAQEKLAALTALVNHVVSGRSDECRAPSAEELKATLVVCMPIEEASLKVRTGPVVDDEADVAAAACWAGIVPLRLAASEAITDALLPKHVPMSAAVTSATSATGQLRRLARTPEDDAQSFDR